MRGKRVGRKKKAHAGCMDVRLLIFSCARRAWARLHANDARAGVSARRGYAWWNWAASVDSLSASVAQSFPAAMTCITSSK